VWSAVPVQRSVEDDAAARFFGRPSDPSPVAAPPGPPPPPPGPPPDDLDSLSDDLGALSSSYGDEYDDLGRGPTPALLAAKAEPLGDPSVARRPNRRPAKPGRPSGASQAAKANRSRNRPNRRKPKEPSKALMALGVVAIIAAGFGAAYFLTRGGGIPGTGEDDAAITDDVVTDSSDETEATSTTAAPTGPAAGLPPVVVFDEAAFGPIQAGVEYNVTVGDGPSDATYQLLVDGEPQAEPAPELAPAMFAPGRHLLEISVISAEGNLSTDPVVVYALGDPPAQGYWANLASVNTDAEVEGWAEAVRRFDEFVAAGHTNLQLIPSDLYPSLPPGYWILYVGGFSDTDTASAYCEEHGLLSADQCWARPFDPNAPAGG
jgi:hypothetical protein